MNVNEIVAEWLKANGYDGLVNDNECGCLHTEIAPCGEICGNCEAGYQAPCDCGEHDWHIVEGKKP